MTGTKFRIVRFLAGMGHGHKHHAKATPAKKAGKFDGVPVDQLQKDTVEGVRKFGWGVLSRMPWGTQQWALEAVKKHDPALYKTLMLAKQ